MKDYGGVKNIFEEQNDETTKELVSLGDHCVVALYLKKFGYKKCSYPFDWLITNIDILIHILEDDFRTFIKEPKFYKKFLKSGELFTHHNMKDNKDYFERCITRFRKLKNKNTTFIISTSRTGGNNSVKLEENHRDYVLDYYIKIVDILQNKYEIKNLQLVVLDLRPIEDDIYKYERLSSNIELHTIPVNLFGAILDKNSENIIKKIYMDKI